MTSPVIGYAGLTHLGINSAAAAAARGFSVIAFDNNLSVVEAIGNGDMPVLEPDLAETIAGNIGRLKFTADPAELTTCDIIYVAADVPTDDTGSSDLTPIEQIIDLVNKSMRIDALLVILCQVPPGFTRTVNRPTATLYYQVETLIFGRAMERAMHPERFIIGCADPELPFPGALSTFLKAFDCPILPMRFESAELAKISINMCLVASISVANTLAEICENIGADWSEIVPSLHLDRRIGGYCYINPGLGIAGGNLERDLATILRLAEAHGTDGEVVAAWVANSKHRKTWARKALDREVLEDHPNAIVAVLGLAYKENTHSTKNSPSLTLLDTLTNTDVRVFDPVVDDAQFAANITQTGSISDAVKDADVLMVMTPWPEFQHLDLAEIANDMRNHTLIDPFRVFSPADAKAAGFSYHTLGLAPQRNNRASSASEEENSCSNI
jgi:UDPglucose 6-dehydrogenase